MAKTKIGVLSNMVNKPVKVFTTFASVDQIEQANGKLPSTSFIVASEVDANNEDTGVFNTFVTDADGYAAQISYINKVCYTSYSTNALYVNKVNNVNSLEARTMSSTQYGVARLASNGGLENANAGLKIKTNSSLTTENNTLKVNPAYINTLVADKFDEGISYVAPNGCYENIEFGNEAYIIGAEFGYDNENGYSYLNFYDSALGYLSRYKSTDSYFDSSNTGETPNPIMSIYLNDVNTYVPAICPKFDYNTAGLIPGNLTSTFTNNKLVPVYQLKLYTKSTNDNVTYTYFDLNTGKLYDDNDIFSDNVAGNETLLFVRRLLSFTHNRYNMIDNSNNKTFTAKLDNNNYRISEINGSVSTLVNNSPALTINDTYSYSIINVNTNNLQKATSTSYGIVKIGNNINITNGQISISNANANSYGVVKIDNDTIKINSKGQIYAKQIENFDELEKLDVETINMLLDLKDKLSTNNLLTTYLTEVNASTNVYMPYNLYNDAEKLDILAYYGTKNKIDNAFSTYSQLYDLTISSLDKSINYTFSTLNSNVFNAYNISGIYSDYRYLTISRSIIKDKNIEFLKVDDIDGIKITSTTYNLLPNIILYGKELFTDEITVFNDISLITKIQKIYSYIKAANDHYIVSDYGYYDRNNKNLYLYIGDICTDESNTNRIGKLACKYNIDLTSDFIRWDIFPFTNTDKCTVTSFNDYNHTEYINIGLSVSKNKQVSLYMKLYDESIVNTIGWLEVTGSNETIKLFYNIPNSGNAKEYMAVSYIHNIYELINPTESVTSTAPPINS